MAHDDLIDRLLRRGGLASAAELDQVAAQLTHAKLAEFNHAIALASIDRPVKVITLIGAPPPVLVRGYITQERYLLDKTPDEMRKILGLRSNDLTTGALILAIAQPLHFTDFKNKGYTYLPGGKPWTPSSPYPIGKGAGQWELVHEVRATSIEALKPGQRYRRGQKAGSVTA